MCHSEWTVEAPRSKKRFRFCKGWTYFIIENNFQVNDELVFHYLGDVTFQVRKV